MLHGELDELAIRLSNEGEGAVEVQASEHREGHEQEAEEHLPSLLAGTSGTSDAMEVDLDGARHLVVDDVLDSLDVESVEESEGSQLVGSKATKRRDSPSRSQIGSEKESRLSLPKLLKTSQPLLLGQITVELVGPLQSLAMEREDDLHAMRLSLGAEEDDGAAGGEGTGAEGDEEGLTRALAGAEASLDGFAGFVPTDTKDCERAVR